MTLEDKGVNIMDGRCLNIIEAVDNTSLVPVCSTRVQGGPRSAQSAHTQLYLYICCKFIKFIHQQIKIYTAQ